MKLTDHTLNIQMLEVHDLACAKGFWDKANFVQCLMLIASEIFECFAAVRNPVILPSRKLPGMTEVAEELADAYIRILDTAAGFRIDLQAAIDAKHEYNKTRPYKHGKAF